MYEWDAPNPSFFCFCTAVQLPGQSSGQRAAPRPVWVWWSLTYIIWLQSDLHVCIYFKSLLLKVFLYFCFCLYSLFWPKPDLWKCSSLKKSSTSSTHTHTHKKKAKTANLLRGPVCACVKSSSPSSRVHSWKNKKIKPCELLPLTRWSAAECGSTCLLLPLAAGKLNKPAERTAKDGSASKYRSRGMQERCESEGEDMFVLKCFENRRRLYIW